MNASWLIPSLLSVAVGVLLLVLVLLVLVSWSKVCGGTNWLREYCI
jgi:hypothetical protein